MFTWTRTQTTPGGPPASAPRSVPQSAAPIAVAPVEAPAPPDASPQARRFTDAAPCATRLGRLQIRGTITGTDSVELAGTVDGPITVEGMCHVLEGGRVNGTITATDVVIAGEVDGHVAARGRLEMAAHARVLADVVASTVAIAEGCFIEGRIHMRGANESDQPTAFKEKRKGKRKGGHKGQASSVVPTIAEPVSTASEPPAGPAPSAEPAAAAAPDGPPATDPKPTGPGAS